MPSSRSRPTSSERASCATSTPKRACAATAVQTRDRLRLALRLDGLGRLVVDGGRGRSVRRLVDDDAVDRCRALQPCRGVDDVAGGHALAGVGLGVEPDERLAGGDADSQLEPFLEREVADRERRADGALGIVLVRGRGTEQGHHRVADELLDGAAVPLELGADALVVRAEERLDVLRIHATRHAAVKPTRSQKTTVTTLRSRRELAITQSLRGAPRHGA